MTAALVDDRTRSLALAGCVAFAGVCLQAGYSASALLLKIRSVEKALIVPLIAGLMIAYGVGFLVVRLTPIGRLKGFVAALTHIVLGALCGLLAIGSFIVSNRLFLWR